MHNSVVVVTGGSGGIGKALIKKYLRQGFFVISADLENTINFEDKNLSFFKCNVECEKSIYNLFTTTNNESDTLATGMYSRINFYCSRFKSRTEDGRRHGNSSDQHASLLNS